MADAREAIGRPLDGAREFENAKCALGSAVAQHQPGDGALGIVGRVLEINQASRGIKGVVDVGASAFRHFGRGIDTGYRCFAAADDRPSVMNSD